MRIDNLVFSTPTIAVSASIKANHAGSKIDSAASHICVFMGENNFATHLSLRVSLVQWAVKWPRARVSKHPSVVSITRLYCKKVPAFTVLLESSVLSVLLVVVILIGIVTIFGLGGTVVAFLCVVPSLDLIE